MKTEYEISICLAQDDVDYQKAKTLILDYIAWLKFDLGFQNIDTEIADLEAMYSAKARGGLLIATVQGKTAGVAGVRRFTDDDCELKRMFVSEKYRNLGLGGKLLRASIALAMELEYKTIKLDTADFMTDAINLYRANGFIEINAYRFNPYPSAKYFELILNNKSHTY